MKRCQSETDTKRKDGYSTTSNHEKNTIHLEGDNSGYVLTEKVSVPWT